MRYENKIVPFQGACCAVVTPFSGDEVDFDSLGVLLDRQISGGVSAIVVCGTTGEAPSLSHDEYRLVIEYAVERIGGRIPVIAGVGSASTSHAAELTDTAAYAGADAVLAVNPYYVKSSEEGLVRHFKKLASVGLPVILYNVPSRTGMSIPISVYEKLVPVHEIVGIKEASGDVRVGQELSYRFGDRYALYSGCDELNLPLAAIGFDGFISVTANVVPDKLSRLWNLYHSGDSAYALHLDRELYPLTKELFREVNPIPVKKKLAEMGLCSGELRLPLY